MLACGALVAIGIVMIVMWGDEEVQGPPVSDGGSEPRGIGLVLRIFLWRLALVFGCGAR